MPPDAPQAGQARSSAPDETARKIQVRQMAFSLALQATAGARIVDQLVKDATLIADFLIGEKHE